MARLGFIADVHVGNHSFDGGPVVAGINRRCQAILDAMRQAVAEAKTHRLDGLIIAGDLFDVADPLPQQLAAVQDILRFAPPTVILMGNHDLVSDATGDHALGPLAALPNVTVIERPATVQLGDAHVACVPFQTGDAREWFPDAFAAAVMHGAPSARPSVAVFHSGVIDEATPAFLSGAHDAVPLTMVQGLLKQHNVAAAFCGNWHAARSWGNVAQISALVPTGFDNPGFDYGLLRTFDTKTGMPGQIHIAGPRFVTAKTEAEVKVAQREAASRGCPLYLSLKGEVATPAALVKARALDGVAAARAVADTGELREATQAAAVAVRHADTLTQALAAYVEKMPVGEGVDRARVLALARGFLKGGA